MNREKYVYNPQTLQYEKEKLPLRAKALRFSGYIFAVLFTAGIFMIAVYKFFPSPKEKALEREISQMEFYYNNLSSDFQSISSQLDKLQQKDADIHRVILGVDPMDEGVWNGGTGGHEKFTDLIQYKRSGELLTSTLERVEKLKRKVKLQEGSFEELSNMAKEREKKLASIPSIKPIQENKLKRKIRSLSGFGWRIHPVHKVKKFHKGIDFTAPTGTAIQATGNGVVERVEKKRLGYGYNVIINHGYGYKTLYAHMKSIDVKKGEKVFKGQKIGSVGSTGTSTAPHLHYEVQLNGKAINPIDYCLDGLSPEEYQELVSRSSVENQSFD